MAAITYQEAREQYPNQWIVFEALDGYIEENRRIIPRLKVMGEFLSWQDAWECYKHLREADKSRNVVFYHTSNEQLDIEVQHRF